MRQLPESVTINPMSLPEHSQLPSSRKIGRRITLLLVLGGIVLVFLALIVVYQVPAVQQRFEWRLEIASVYLRTLLRPIGDLPTPLVADQPETAPPQASATLPAVTATAAVQPTEADTPPSPTPEATRVVLPSQVNLQAPPFEGQDWNNCGPVSLSMQLNYFGWNGDQYGIAEKIKPLRADRNVNIEELSGYVYQNIWWLKAVFRVGGNIELLRSLIHAGLPVLVEETMFMEEEFWFNDDRWAGHYLLLTGYDDIRQVFTTQDSFVGPNRQVGYLELDRNWQAFNRVYLVIYPPEQEEAVINLLGTHWDADQNRLSALATAEAETRKEPQNAFAWFNLGSNLVYFERYAEAASAYDYARKLELPQRMLRYQFGPFLAYFHSNRAEELLTLAEYALTVTPNSEEALLWKGWALYRLNRRAEALSSFQAALEYHPGYSDAEYAISFIQGQ